MAKRKPKTIKRRNLATGEVATMNRDQAEEYLLGGLCGALDLSAQLDMPLAVTVCLAAALGIAVDAVSGEALLKLGEKRLGRDVIDDLVAKHGGVPKPSRRRRAAPPRVH